jgi:glycosyltransferase involved in cell wall biosynthesis
MTGGELAGRRVLIVEDDPNGHRLIYVRHLVEHANRAGASVVAVVTRNVPDAEQWRLNLAPLSDRMEVRVVDGAELDDLVDVTDALAADHTIVADGDHLAMRLGVARRWRGAGTLTVLLMRDPADEVAETWKRRLVTAGKSLLLWRTRRLARVHVVGLRSALAQPSATEPVALDPIERHADGDDVARIRAEWHVTDDRFWFGVVGAVTPRKNLPLVAEAVGILAATDDAGSLGLLVAGPCHDGVLDDAAPHLDRLRELGVEVLIADRVLGPVDFDAAAQAVDCIVVAHSNEGPSAVIARAGLHGVPVVAAGARSLARDVERLPVASWTQLDATAMAAAMREVRAGTRGAAPLDLGTDQFCDALLRPLYEKRQSSAMLEDGGEGPAAVRNDGGRSSMKILVISNLYLPDHAGGASIYSDLCAELAARGHDVTVRCAYPYFPEWQDKSGDNGWSIERSTIDGVKIERHGLFIPRNPRSLVHRMLYEGSFLASLLRGLWRSERPDVIVAFSTMLSPVAFASLASRVRKRPLMVNVQDLTSGGATAAELVTGRVAKVLASTETRILSSADLLVTISPEMVESLGRMTSEKVPISYAPNWLNESQADVIRSLPVKGPRDAGRPLDLLYAGNIGNKQNLVEFCEHLHRSDLRVRLSVHASGPGADALTEWWTPHRDDRFEFGPFLDEGMFVKRMHECDMFLITERSGSGSSYMPSKLIPAIATGTPVLAVCDEDSSLGREMTRSGLGPSIRWDRLDALAEAVEQADDPARYAAWQEAARDRSRDFDRTTIIDGIEDSLRRLAAGRAAPHPPLT